MTTKFVKGDTIVVPKGTGYHVGVNFYRTPEDMVATYDDRIGAVATFRLNHRTPDGNLGRTRHDLIRPAITTDDL